MDSPATSLRDSQFVLPSIASALGLILIQFFLASAALFIDPSLWAVHGMVGGTVSLPLIALLVIPARETPSAELRFVPRLLFVTHLMQVLLAAASDAPHLLALRTAHVANASFLLSVAWHLAHRATRLVRKLGLRVCPTRRLAADLWKARDSAVRFTSVNRAFLRRLGGPRHRRGVTIAAPLSYRPARGTPP